MGLYELFLRIYDMRPNFKGVNCYCKGIITNGIDLVSFPNYSMEVYVVREIVKKSAAQRIIF